MFSGKRKIQKVLLIIFFGNPVRKGLAEDYKKYKLLGSFEFDILQG
jgi:hypothetical protein